MSTTFSAKDYYDTGALGPVLFDDADPALLALREDVFATKVNLNTLTADSASADREKAFQGQTYGSRFGLAKGNPSYKPQDADMCVIGTKIEKINAWKIRSNPMARAWTPREALHALKRLEVGPCVALISLKLSTGGMSDPLLLFAGGSALHPTNVLTDTQDTLKLDLSSSMGVLPSTLAPFMLSAHSGMRETLRHKSNVSEVRKDLKVDPRLLVVPDIREHLPPIPIFDKSKLFHDLMEEVEAEAKNLIYFPQAHPDGEKQIQLFRQGAEPPNPQSAQPWDLTSTSPGADASVPAPVATTQGLPPFPQVETSSSHGGLLFLPPLLHLPPETPFPSGLLINPRKVPYTRLMQLLKHHTGCDNHELKWLESPFVTIWYAAMRNNPSLFAIPVSPYASLVSSMSSAIIQETHIATRYLRRLEFAILHQFVLDHALTIMGKQQSNDWNLFSKAILNDHNASGASNKPPPFGYSATIFQTPLLLFLRPPCVHTWHQSLLSGVYDSDLDALAAEWAPHTREITDLKSTPNKPPVPISPSPNGLQDETPRKANSSSSTTNNSPISDLEASLGMVQSWGTYKPSPYESHKRKAPPPPSPSSQPKASKGRRLFGQEVDVEETHKRILPNGNVFDPTQLFATSVTPHKANPWQTPYIRFISYQTPMPDNPSSLPLAHQAAVKLAELTAQQAITTTDTTEKILAFRPQQAILANGTSNLAGIVKRLAFLLAFPLDDSTPIYLDRHNNARAAPDTVLVAAHMGQPFAQHLLPTLDKKATTQAAGNLRGWLKTQATKASSPDSLGPACLFNPGFFDPDDVLTAIQHCNFAGSTLARSMSTKVNSPITPWHFLSSRLAATNDDKLPAAGLPASDLSSICTNIIWLLHTLTKEPNLATMVGQGESPAHRFSPLVGHLYYIRTIIENRQFVQLWDNLKTWRKREHSKAFFHMLGDLFDKFYFWTNTDHDPSNVFLTGSIENTPNIVFINAATAQTATIKSELSKWRSMVDADLSHSALLSTALPNSKFFTTPTPPVFAPPATDTGKNGKKGDKLPKNPKRPHPSSDDEDPKGKTPKKPLVATKPIIKMADGVSFMPFFKVDEAIKAAFAESETDAPRPPSYKPDADAAPQHICFAYAQNGSHGCRKKGRKKCTNLHVDGTEEGLKACPRPLLENALKYLNNPAVQKYLQPTTELKAFLG